MATAEHVRAQHAAHAAVHAAIVRGVLPPLRTLTCYHCPNPARLYHHYQGYEPAQRLAVMPLCRRHHGLAHKPGSPQNLRYLRRLKGWTQSDLARAAGVSVEAISALERRYREAHPSTMTKIARALGVRITSVDEFVQPPAAESPPATTD